MINNPAAEIRDLVNALNKMTEAQSRSAKKAEQDQKRRQDSDKLLNAETNEYIETLTKGRKLSEKQLEVESQLRKAKRAELELEREITKTRKHIADALRNQNKEAAATQQKILQDQLRTHGRATAETAKYEGKFKSALRGLADSATIAETAILYFSQGLMNSYNQARDQMAANVGLVEGTDYLTGMLNQSGEAFKHGIGTVDFAKMTTANRQMINAMGGTTNAMKALEGSSLTFFTMTGNQTEAYKLMLDASTSFAQKGIKPTQDVIQSYAADVKTLAAQTGMSAEAAASFYNSVSDDVDSITLLRAARADEREAILKSQRAMLRNATAAGMSAEQAQEAAKMLNKMVAAKPLDRIKQAAKIRAIGGALGIAGSNEAADALMAGKRATAQQKQALMTFNQNTTNKVDQASQQGMGAELFTSQLVDKLGMDNQFGPGSPFSTTLGDVLGKPIEQTRAMYADAAKSTIGQGMQMIEVMKQMATDIRNGTIVMNTIVSGFDSLIKFFNGEDAANWISDGMANALPGFTNAIGASIDLLAIPIHAVAGAVSMIAGAIAKLFGASEIAKSLFNVAKDKFDSGREALHLFGTDKSAVNAGLTSSTGKQIATPRPVNSATSTKVGEQTAKVDTQQAQKDEKATQAVVDTASASQDTSQGIQQQLRKMDDNAVLMQKLVTNSDKAIDLAEKQLIALTMSDQDRTSGVTRVNLRRDNRFGAQYGYI